MDRRFFCDICNRDTQNASNFDSHVTGLQHRKKLQQFGELLPPVQGHKEQVFFDDVDLDDDRFEYAPVRAPTNVSFKLGCFIIFLAHYYYDINFRKLLILSDSKNKILRIAKYWTYVIIFW